MDRQIVRNIQEKEKLAEKESEREREREIVFVRDERGYTKDYDIQEILLRFAGLLGLYFLVVDGFIVYCYCETSWKT